MTLRRYPEVKIKEAKAKADALREEVLKGVNPKASLPVPPPALASPTFKEMAEDFYSRWVVAQNRQKTQAFRRWVLNKYVLPALQDYKVSELDSFIIIKFLDTLGRTPVLQNRVKGILSKMFNWAGLRYPDLTGNLTRGYERKKEKPRDRRLSEDEIRALGVAYLKKPDPLKTVPIFLLLTGARSGVALHMVKEHQFLDEKLLRFPEDMDGLKGCRRVYLPSPAMDLLPNLPAKALHRSLWRTWTQFRAEAHLGPTKEDPKCGVSFHDLRRTFGFIGVDLGHDEAVVDALLSHSRGRIRDTYLLRSDPVLAQVAEEIGQHIAGLLGLEVGEEGAVNKVIPLRKVASQA